MTLVPEDAPDRQPVGTSGVPGVQREPKTSQLLTVPDSWLADRRFDQASLHVDRLAGDLDLYNTLALGGFLGPDYDYFADELARYGLAVIGAWVRSGLIYARCRDRGMGGLAAPDWELDVEDVEELTNLTVGIAVVKFRETVLMRGRWHPHKGASLRTFFIGQCLIRFANVYRTWLDGQEARQTEVHVPDERCPPVRPLDRAVDNMVAEAELGQIENPRVRKAMLYTAAGWRHWEIAHELCVSVKTVERMLANERARIQKRRSA